MASALTVGSSMLLLSLLPAASAMAKTAPMVTAVTLSGEQGTVAVGSTVSFTATAKESSAGPVWYQFWYQGVHGNWHGMNWSKSDHFSLPALQNGSYEVVAYAKTANQKMPVSSESTMSNQFVNVGSTLTISTNGKDAAPNGAVTVTAQSTNLTDPVYQYWVGTPNGKGGYNWQANGDYTASTTYTFHPPASGKYQVVVYAKDLNAPQDAQFSLAKVDWVNVFGDPASVQLTPSTSTLAADGSASETITATVLDSSGNVVSNYNGTVGVIVTPNQFTGGLSIVPLGANNANTANDTPKNPFWFTAKNGVATINVAELYPGTNITDGLFSGVVGDTASVVPILPHGSLETGNAAKITLTAPQPTYDMVAQVTAPPSESPGGLFSLAPLPSVLANNDAIQIAPVVADQNQIPMNGSTGIGDGGTAVISVSGPATLDYYNGNGIQETNLTSVTMPIDAENAGLDNVFLVPTPGQTGTVTVTISNVTNGLQVVSPVQIKVVPPGTLSGWSGPSGFTFTADQVANDNYAQHNLSESLNTWLSGPNGTTTYGFGVQAVDQNGLSVPAPKPSVSVTTASGQAVADLSATVSGDAKTGQYFVTMVYNGQGLAAGTYNVTISEGLTKSLVVPVTITTGRPYQLAVMPSQNTPAGAQQVVDVTPQNPSLTISAQIEDVLGNPVAAPNGTSITFQDTSNVKPINNIQSGEPLQLSGGTGTPSDQTVYVNGNGMASITATALSKGNDGDVYVTANLPSGYSLYHAQQYSASVVETGSLVSQLVATTQGSGYVAGTGSGYPEVLVSEENAAHAIMDTGDTLNYTITSTNPFYGTVNGTVNYNGPNSVIPVTTNMAGTYTVKIWDASNSAVAPITATVTVDAGPAAGVGLFANGMEISQDVPDAANYSTDTNYNVKMSGDVTATANTPIAVWVHATDSTGNIVNAPAGGVTVNLTAGSSTAAFETQSGQVISQVTIPAGQNGVEVWLVDSHSQKVSISAAYVQAAVVTFAGTNKGVATQGGKAGAYTYAWNVNVMDQFGNPITSLSSNDAMVVDTSASPNLNFSSGAGNLTLVPVTGSPGEYTLTVTNATTVPTTDVANITIDGGSANGTF